MPHIRIFVFSPNYYTFPTILTVLYSLSILKGDLHDSLWMRFESLFNNTPLGEKINQHLKTNHANYQFIILYLRDFIFMEIFPLSSEQFGVSKHTFTGPVG